MSATISYKEVIGQYEEHVEAMNRIFQYDEESGTLTIDTGYPYDIDLSRIHTPEFLLRWVVQLSQKNWMTSELIGEFIIRVCGIKGWQPFGL